LASGTKYNHFAFLASILLSFNKKSRAAASALFFIRSPRQLLWLCSHFISPNLLLCNAAIQKVGFDYVCVCIQFLSQISAELQLLRRCK